MSTFAHEYPNPNLLVDTNWLEEHLEDENIVVVDSENDNALRRAYRRAHIPGAVSIVSPHFKNPDDLAHASSLEQVADLMSELGIGDDTMVIGYDCQRSLYATRLWLILNLYGHDKVRVLNGGWNKWCEEERPITNKEPRISSRIFTPKTNESFRRTADYIEDSLGRNDVVIVDVRHHIEYVGDPSYKPTVPNPFPSTKRGGHVPGAIHLEAKYVLSDKPWTFRPAEELRQMFEEAGITSDKEIITYCEHGTRSAQGVFALRLMGYEKARLFDGGWMEWGNREDAPIET